MIRFKYGWTAIELLVALAIFFIIITIPYGMFIRTLHNTSQQYDTSKSALEKFPVLEILRKDIETAGFGLPWLMGGKVYSEANSDISFNLYSSVSPSSFNDAPSNVPAAINGNTDNSSGYSYLVLRGSVFSLNKAANHWTYIYDDNGIEKLNIWPDNNTSNYNNLHLNDDVIVLNAATRELMGETMYYTVKQNPSVSDTKLEDYLSLDLSQGYLPQGNYIVYGIRNGGSIAAPFNRIDYVLYNETDPSRICAQGTHTLGRMIFNNNGDGNFTKYPFLRCVADFQVWFEMNIKGDDGQIKTFWIQNLTTYTSLQIRQSLKKIAVFILVQNGRADKNYIFPDSSVFVGDRNLGIGRTFYFNKHGFSQTGLTSYKHYRWKLLELIIKPMNLEGG